MNIRESIEQSFKSLVLTTPYEKISIKSICELSSVSRTMFYSYYIDKDDLLGKIVESELIQPIKQLNQILPVEKIKSSQQLLLERFCQGVLDNKEFYRRVNADKSRRALARILTKGFTEFNTRILEVFDVSPVEKDYMAHFAAGSFAVLLSKWIDDDYDIEPHELARFYRKWTMSYWISISPTQFNPDTN